jgi:hypothetical protein
MGLADQGIGAQFPTEIFHFFTVSTPLGPIQPFIQWVLGASYCRGKAMKESLLNRHIIVLLLESVPHAMTFRTRTCHPYVKVVQMKAIYMFNTLTKAPMG